MFDLHKLKQASTLNTTPCAVTVLVGTVTPAMGPINPVSPKHVGLVVDAAEVEVEVVVSGAIVDVELELELELELRELEYQLELAVVVGALVGAAVGDAVCIVVKVLDVDV